MRIRLRHCQGKEIPAEGSGFRVQSSQEPLINVAFGVLISADQRNDWISGSFGFRLRIALWCISTLKTATIPP